MKKKEFDEFLKHVRHFVNTSLVTCEEEVEKKSEIPEKVVEKMRKMGLFGVTIPSSYGGKGLSFAQTIELNFVLGTTSPAFQFILGSNHAIGSYPLLRMGTKTQKSRYLPKLASGEIISSFALTEEDAGSDPSNIKTLAIKHKKGWIINGTKCYISNAPRADLFIIIARIENTTGKNGITAFLVGKETPGLIIGKIDEKMGHNGAHTASIKLNNCFIPQDGLLGELGKGLKLALESVNIARLLSSAVMVGIADRLIHDCISYATSRQQFGKTISNFQLIQAMLADSYTESYVARCSVRETAKQLDHNKEKDFIPDKIAVCKLFCSEIIMHP